MATEKQLQGKIKMLKGQREAALRKATKLTKKEIAVQEKLDKKARELLKQVQQSEKRYDKALKPVDKLDEKIALAENALRAFIREQQEEPRRPDESDGEE